MRSSTGCSRGRRRELVDTGGWHAMRALISVYDKHGIEIFARGLADLGFELVSSGGTAAFLEEHGLDGDARRGRDRRRPRCSAAA